MSDNGESFPNDEQAPRASTPADIIQRHVFSAVGVGLIPVPLVDLVGLATIQLNLLRRLAALYGVPFRKDKGKHLLAVLLGGGIPVTIGGTLASLVKAVPVVGQTAGAAVMPATAGATTYAVGKVFDTHFSSGGTLLDFDPAAVRRYYAQMLREGEEITQDLRADHPGPEVEAHGNPP
jgi:uncharacterized protein (DUF697 family)